jgi:2'-5' RNA ligase superfamily protein
VRASWAALREAGLPSQLDHRGATNEVHLTVVAAPGIPPAAVDAARQVLGPLLPLRVRASGLLVLGGSRVTLARAVDVDDTAVDAVLRVRALVPERQHPGWLPHVTLARRVPRERVQEALDVLGWDDEVLTLTELRRWDPDAGTVVTVARTGDACAG